MTMRLTNEFHIFKNEDEPLLKYCGGVQAHVAGKKHLRKLKSFPWLVKPDDAKNSDDEDSSDEDSSDLESDDEEKYVDEQRERIIFEIESDEQDEDPQIYELMYVSLPSSSHILSE